LAKDNKNFDNRSEFYSHALYEGKKSAYEFGGGGMGRGFGVVSPLLKSEKERGAQKGTSVGVSFDLGRLGRGRWVLNQGKSGEKRNLVLLNVSLKDQSIPRQLARGMGIEKNSAKGGGGGHRKPTTIIKCGE